uniref:Uncharacterized protein n=1 Tax=Caenorhabditis japonica TaxID=281687 RepID=A0A8R1ES75_CAEJA
MFPENPQYHSSAFITQDFVFYGSNVVACVVNAKDNFSSNKRLTVMRSLRLLVLLGVHGLMVIHFSFFRFFNGDHYVTIASTVALLPLSAAAGNPRTGFSKFPILGICHAVENPSLVVIADERPRFTQISDIMKQPMYPGDDVKTLYPKKNALKM